MNKSPWLVCESCSQPTIHNYVAETRNGSAGWEQWYICTHKTDRMIGDGCGDTRMWGLNATASGRVNNGKRERWAA